MILTDVRDAFSLSAIQRTSVAITSICNGAKLGEKGDTVDAIDGVLDHVLGPVQEHANPAPTFAETTQAPIVRIVTRKQLTRM